MNEGRSGAKSSWDAMKQRCTNPKDVGFVIYGGRGITICERWLNFEAFFADMGPRPPGYSIERIDNNGNYEPANCKWIPKGDQHKNRRPRKSFFRLEPGESYSRPRIDASIWHQLKAEACAESISVEAYLYRLIEAHLQKEQRNA
jgi:hypothetical protein